MSGEVSTPLRPSNPVVRVGLRAAIHHMSRIPGAPAIVRSSSSDFC
jgi:hypothetical protein